MANKKQKKNKINVKTKKHQSNHERGINQENPPIVVPAKRYIQIPIRVFWCSCIIGGIFLLTIMVLFGNVRKEYEVQVNEVERLAQSAEKLQQDMERLNKLDAEIRFLVTNEKVTDVSRSTIFRPVISSTNQASSVVTVPNLEYVAQIVKELESNIPEREQSLSMLRSTLIERNERLAYTPSVWPANGQVTSRFGSRSRDWHPGIDIANDYGTPIIAAASGQVIFSGWNDGGYGQMVKIDHGNGIVTLYAHAAYNVVRVGEKVQKGAVIAYMGSTGVSTGCHVHYEVRVNDKPVDPAKFL